MADRILIVEDDRKLAPLVKRYLEDHHFQVEWVADGDEAERRFTSFRPDLVVLDLMLPGRDGLSLCREIRNRHRTAILILTAKGDETDRVIGLELGADDYLTKPFGLKELLARIRAILRRYHGSPPDGQDQRVLGPFSLDTSHRTLRRDGEDIVLTRSEFDLLELLTRNAGRVFRRDELLHGLRGGEADAFDRAIDTHISNLRRKIETDPKNPRYIITVWGLGYRWGQP
jgi:two-component system phosphate regulon response regulator OmpR